MEMLMKIAMCYLSALKKSCTLKKWKVIVEICPTEV